MSAETDPVADTEAPGKRFASSLNRTKGTHPLWRIFGFLSSLWTAAISLAGLGIVTGIATYYEADYGREAAWIHIYGTWWFGLIFGLLAVNIFGAAAVRYPWKKHQTGFVITHVGLLTIMAGFAVSTQRLDGMLVAVQGEPAHEIEMPMDVLVVEYEPTGERETVFFNSLEKAGYPSFARYLLHLVRIAPVERPIVSDSDQRIPLGEVGGRRFALRRVVDTAIPDAMAFEASTGGAPAISIDLDVTQPGAAAPENIPDLWIGAGGTRTFGPILTLGLADTAAPRPLLDLLAEDPGELATEGRLLVSDGNEAWAIPVVPKQTVDITSRLALRFQTYIGHVEQDAEGKYSHVEGSRANPMLLFQVGTGPADQRRWLEQTLATGATPAPIPVGGLTVWYQHPTRALANPDGEAGGAVTVIPVDEKQVGVLAWSNKRGRRSFEIVEAGWNGTVLGGEGVPMRIDATIGQWLPSARSAPIPVDMQPDKKDRARTWIELEVEDGTQRMRGWLERGTFRALDLEDDRRLLIRYDKARYDLKDRHGFSVVLDRFINEKDPGGEGNASYKSRVNVVPTNGDETVIEEISMNEPYFRDGVALYQTARTKLGDGRFVSFFTAATDPGRLLKYLGSAILVAGIVTMYVMRMRRRRTRPTGAT